MESQRKRSFTVVSFRALMDQEASLMRDYNEGLESIDLKMEKVITINKIGKLVMKLALVFAASSAVFMIMDNPVSAMTTKLAVGLILLRMALFLVERVGYFIMSNKATANFHLFDKKRENIWGRTEQPSISYRFDEYLKEYELFLEFEGDDDPAYIGRVSEDDELAQNFKIK